MLAVVANGDRATELACDIRLHQSFTLLPNSSIGRNQAIRVTYSDVGYSSPGSATDEPAHPDGKETPVVLWASGMFGGRYQGMPMDDLCKRYRVRFLAIDRPGIGGTELVSLNQRIATWLDMVPALLEHVGVKHVHLVAHSAGTIFVLNTILHQRHLLHPTKPFVAMFGPWIHPSKSKNWGLAAVSLLPELAIGTWHHWAKMINQNIAPVLRASGLPVTKASRTSVNANSRSQVTEDSNIDDDTEATWRKASEAVITNYVFAENVEGASHEALLCLRKGTTTWGDWRDIDEAILRIAHTERTRQHTLAGEDGGKLRFQVYFAQNDEMTGTGGQKWLESCFRQDGALDSLIFEAEVVAGTDHNDVLALQNGAMERMVQVVAQEASVGGGKEGGEEGEEAAAEVRTTRRSRDVSKSDALER